MDQGLLLRFEPLEEAHWWFAARRRLVLESVRRLVPVPPRRILEVGCGTGGTLASLAAAYPHAEVLGVEPCEAALRLAQAKGCNVVAGEFAHLPVDAGWADVLLALDVLEHLPDQDAALAQAHHALRSGGRLILTVPALPWLWSQHDEINAHLRRYRRKDLQRVILHAGFRLERLTYFNTLLLPLGVIERMMVRLLNAPASFGLKPPPRPMNAFLRWVFGLEVGLLRTHNLPIGMSLLAVASRTAES
jgi:SAM-dependent methyltransferase